MVWPCQYRPAVHLSLETLSFPDQTHQNQSGGTVACWLRRVLAPPRVVRPNALRLSLRATFQREWRQGGSIRFMHDLTPLYSWAVSKLENSGIQQVECLRSRRLRSSEFAPGRRMSASLRPSSRNEAFQNGRRIERSGAVPKPRVAISSSATQRERGWYLVGSVERQHDGAVS